MTRAVFYPPANRTAQWFGDDYAGVPFTSVRAVVLHTTEGAGWPGYSGGAAAPNLTAYPDPNTHHVTWRQHYRLDRSSRALMNPPGGVNTNSTQVVQVEMIGTCDRSGPKGALYWPDAPDWALRGIADFLAFMHKEWAVPLTSPVPGWLPYPASYGNSRVRLSGAAWLAFRGVLGHEHVAENDHGDPGDLNIVRLLALARGIPGGDDIVTPDDIEKIAQAAADAIGTRISYRDKDPYHPEAPLAWDRIMNDVYRYRDNPVALTKAEHAALVADTAAAVNAQVDVLEEQLRDIRALVTPPPPPGG